MRTTSQQQHWTRIHELRQTAAKLKSSAHDDVLRSRLLIAEEELDEATRLVLDPAEGDTHVYRMRVAALIIERAAASLDATYDALRSWPGRV